MAVTNNLKVWSSNNTYADDTAFNSDTYLTRGFDANDPISSKTFNTVLLELTKTNKAIYDALATIGSTLTATIDLSTQESDIATFVKAALEKTVVNTAGYATASGKSENLVGGAAGSIAYQTAADTTNFIARPVSGNKVLGATGGNNPEYKEPTEILVAASSSGTTAPSSDVTSPYVNTKFDGVANSSIRFVGSGGTTVTGNGSIITIDSSTVAPTDLPASYITTPPQTVNTNGIKFVLLDSTVYAPASVSPQNGYIYMWY